MLTLQFIPHHEIENLNSDARINKLLEIVKGNEIVLLEGRLDSEEETKLIQRTMEEISSVFKGVELCTIYPSKRRTKKLDVGNFIKNGLTKMLLGNKEGLTIIGPATIVKQIKRDPRKIQLLIKTRRKR